MIAIDTNILIRFLVGDDRKQMAQASELLERYSKDSRIFINQIVLCEVVWVLLGAYKFSKDEVAKTIENLLMTEAFEIESRQEIWDALLDYRAASSDFADCLIGRKNKSNGCSSTFSFDKSLKTNVNFTVIK
jgi:predicted nucleic-acid-binding protein